MKAHHSRHSVFKAGRPAPFLKEHHREHFPPSLELEPVHMKLDLHLFLQERRILSKITYEIVANRKGANKLVLDAMHFSNLKVRDLSKQAIDWDYNGEKLTLLWKEAFSKQEKREVEIEYVVESPIAGILFSSPDKDFPEKPLFVCSDSETERARYWIPTVDQPNVRTTLEFKIRTPENLTVLANGFFVGKEKHEDATKTVSWKLEQRCPSYLICFAVGDFISYDDGEWKGIPVRYFGDKRFSPEDLKRSFGRTKEMLAWMTEKLGVDFPYPKYFQFAARGVGGAMENISLVSWDEMFVLDATFAQEFTWLLDQINVHEMAHSYFGDWVVCREHAHAWLKEAWATYIETCWLEDSMGEDEKYYNLYRDAATYIEEADESYVRALMTRKYDSSFQLYDAHLYPGGACRLHTLREKIGDDCFWEATQAYLSRYAEKYVETDDFRKVMEEFSGQSLVQFFNQWILGEGYPDIQVTFEYDLETKKGTFCVEQSQVKEKSQIVFDLQTELSWKTGGVEFTEAIHLHKEKHEFTFTMEEKPSWVRFDPHWKILHKLRFSPEEELLLNQLHDSKDVVGRIHASHELAKTGKSSNLRAISKAFEKESFWGVRQQMIIAVCEANTRESIEICKQWVVLEKNPMVQETLFSSIHGFQCLELSDLVLKKLQSKELGYLATRSALGFLGKQREKAPLDVLLEFAEKEDFHGLVQGGAFVALAETRQLDSVEKVLEQTFYGKNKTLFGRKGAIQSLGMIAPFAKKAVQERIRETCEKHLLDTDSFARLAAVEALSKMNATESIPLIENARKQFPLQWQVCLLDPHLEKLFLPAHERDKKRETQMETLQKELREIKEKLEKLENKKI